jgi:hypothetical protein
LGHFAVKSANFAMKMKEILAARCPFFLKSASQVKLKMGETMGRKQNFGWFGVNFSPIVVKSGRPDLTSRHVSGAGKENTDQGL